MHAVYWYTIPADRAQGMDLTGSPSFILVYATEDVSLAPTLRRFAERFPGVPVFGATSYQGVFSPAGFTRGCAALMGEASDGVEVAVAGGACGASDAAYRVKDACAKLVAKLGGAPEALLLHATVGCEEQLLTGIGDALGEAVPIYGGTAADDHIAGRWAVFHAEEILRQGFVLAGFRTRCRIRGAFLAGYLPTGHSGHVTEARGRTVLSIDGRPAAQVYETWTDGLIARAQAQGQALLAATTMHPIGRTVGESMGLPRRLISHVHAVDPTTGALSFFSAFIAGDQIELMTCTREQLVTRMGRTVERALGHGRPALLGGLFAYCGGSLSAVLDRGDEIAAEFARAAGPGVPFIGAATFGEQGFFFDRRSNRHGNLMCTATLFEADPR